MSKGAECCLPFPTEEWITQNGISTSGNDRHILRALAAGMDQGLVVLDEMERLVLINPAACRIFGLPGSLSPGLGVTELPLPPQVRGSWLTFLGSGRADQSQTARVDLGGGARMLSLRFLKARNRQGEPLSSLLLVQDITPNPNNPVLRADLCHDLRTRLAAVVGLAQELGHGKDLSEVDRQEFLRLFRDEAADLGRGLEALLSSVQEGPQTGSQPKARIELGSLVRECIEDVKLKGLDPELPIQVYMPNKSCSVAGPPDDFKKAVAQALLHASRSGGSPRGIRVTVEPAGEKFRIVVREWGSKIPPEKLAGLLEPGSSASLKGENISGLAQCAAIARAHGGSFWMEVPGDGGLALTLELPAFEDKIGQF